MADQQGCVATGEVTITQPSALAVSINSSTDVSCFGGRDGGADLSVSGGSVPYTYAWLNGETMQVVATSEDLVDVGIGYYSVTGMHLL